MLLLPERAEPCSLLRFAELVAPEAAREVMPIFLSVSVGMNAAAGSTWKVVSRMGRNCFNLGRASRIVSYGVFTVRCRVH